jgi:uncharacterized membrane protein (UPF0127 family)
VIDRRAAGGLALLALSSVAACSNASTGPRVILPSGKAITVEVAVTDQEKAQGLMFRESMPKDAGMVFPFDGLEIRPFWMKNCHFPLDMIYATKDGTIVDVLKNVPPCAPDPAPCENVTPKAKADTVLEVNAGVADAQGAVPGAKLKFVSIPGR